MSSISSLLQFLKARHTRTGGLTRCLTLPLESPQRIGLRRNKQQTFDQSNSLLFRLPLELREIIWMAVLGGRCIARDLGGVRVGDSSNPWPAYERLGEQRRGLRTWGWRPDQPRNFISLLFTCRQIYSEAINFLYSANIYYFRNPFTNWSLSSWRISITRLEQIRVLILDETIGDPSLMFSAKRQWKQAWQVISQMRKLKVLYISVDSLYPRAWTMELEHKLLAPVGDVEQVTELQVIIRWARPGQLATNFPQNPIMTLARLEDYVFWEELYQACPAADMRAWIMAKLTLLESGQL